MPKRIPHDLESFAPFVAADVKVYRDGKLAFTELSAEAAAGARAPRFAGLGYPVEGDTLLFSAAPSFISTRYAARVIRRPNTTMTWATLVRLERRSDCNVLDRTGTWDFELRADETRNIVRRYIRTAHCRTRGDVGRDDGPVEAP